MAEKTEEHVAPAPVLRSRQLRVPRCPLCRGRCVVETRDRENRPRSWACPTCLKQWTAHMCPSCKRACTVMTRREDGQVMRWRCRSCAKTYTKGPDHRFSSKYAQRPPPCPECGNPRVWHSPSHPKGRQRARCRHGHVRVLRDGELLAARRGSPYPPRLEWKLKETMAAIENQHLPLDTHPHLPPKERK